jgi:hypothetical protein
VLAESIAETSFSIPVYRSWPDKPYEVVGTVRCDNPHQEWNDDIIGQAVDEAKKHRGDALIIRIGAEIGVSENIGIAEDPMAWRANQTTALVIKWKSKQAVEEEAAKLRALKEQFQAMNPALSQNPALIDEVIKYLQQVGVTPDSGNAAQRLKTVMDEIRRPSGGDLGGKWLYRCTCQRRQLTTSQTDSFYGIALVTLTDNALTIVSTAPSSKEVNFSGTFDKGRVTGKIGIATASIPSDGVAASEKISLSGQGQISDGTFQTSLILLR